MGSKAAMLRNGLGEVLARFGDKAERFYDLMSGSGRVSWFIAERCEIPVVASDLQSFSRYLAAAVIERTRPVSAERIWADWSARVRPDLRAESDVPVSPLALDDERRSAAESSESFVRAYGGYYYSSRQAEQLVALRHAVPRHEPDHSIAMAALIAAASRCCAAPGHTAQPFNSTSAAALVLATWKHDVLSEAHAQLSLLAERYALRRGYSQTVDAETAASEVQAGSLVFLDPPYAGYQYSRFYHVLESITRGWCGRVSGVGRYPPIDERPQSQFSSKTKAASALYRLLETLSARRAVVILTFPQDETSNGLSSKLIESMAAPLYRCEPYSTMHGSFSTMGGNGSHRPARQPSQETILVLRPRVRQTRRSNRAGEQD